MSNPSRQLDQTPAVAPVAAGGVGPAGQLNSSAKEKGTAPQGSPAGPRLHVIGIDLSLTATGVACKHGTEVITSKGREDDTVFDRHHRLLRIREDILSWCRDADLVVIEQPAYSRVGGHNHDRSGLWWLTLHALFATGRPVAEVAPTVRAKYATGKGNASKDQVLSAVVRRFPEELTVTSNNAADALTLCAMGHDAFDDPIVTMPAAHREALHAVRWPVISAGALT